MAVPSLELAAKLATLRATIERHALAGIRLRGLDWFAWATGGGAGGVLLAAEIGVAELLVTAGGAWVVTSNIEAARLQDEEVPVGLEIVAFPWQTPAEWDAYVAQQTG